MNLSKSELQVLRAVSLNPGINIKNISGKTGLSEPRVYSIVRDLRGRGLVKPSRTYNMALYPSAMQLSRALRSQRDGLIEEAFAGKRLGILEALYEGSRSVEEISQAVDLSDKRVYNYLQWFESFGLVRNVKGRYVLLKDHPLYGSLRLLLSKPVKIPFEVEQNAFVSWVGEGEYIVHTSDPGEYRQGLQDNFLAVGTACSALDYYGIHVIPSDTTLYVTGRETDTIKRAKKGCMPLEDLIIHLLLDDPYSEKTRRYVHWLIQRHEDRIDFRYLRRKALEYNLQKKIESMLYDLKPVLRRRK
ncbi:MAG: winged helix-turn-helix transcriptional regulator [Candidatus Altiarchaeales archaeon]|nr:winged helix-turn-helix transcriptional regulator [Candidatus Altiarchaeales archaeon]